MRILSKLALAAASAAVLTAPAAKLAAQQPMHGWHVDTKEHVDLWLHGFAMLTSDTGRVPFFVRNYRQTMTALKQQKNITTLLDANRVQLQQRFVANPALTNAQFVAMYFNSFPELVQASNYLGVSQNPRSASDPEMRRDIALLAANFPTQADREWLRLFVQSLQDEDTRFYHDYWQSEQGARAAGFTAFNQHWGTDYFPKFSRFLSGTQQGSGDLLLSLPMGGEGRTVSGGKDFNIVAVAYPRTADSSVTALYAFAHEAIAKLVEEAITDNTTPAEKRSGATVGYSGNGAVRAGAVLIQRVAPELAAGYMRYYLQVAAQPIPAGDPTAAFDATFPLPQSILDAVSRQIGVVLGGI